MTQLIELYQKKDFVFSIEIFPPKTENGMEKLKTMLDEFQCCCPDYISVTYGAGGTSRENTHELATHIHHELQIPAMAHLTCVAHTEEEIDAVLTKLRDSDITNVMALRGDPQIGSDKFIQPEGGYHYASELISGVKAHSNFGIGAAGYPEGHIENPDKEDDRKHLHEKIDAGADLIVTQFFLDNEHFLKWRDVLHQEGVQVPLIAGILPQANWAAMKRICDICGVSIPDKLEKEFKKHQNDPEASVEIGLQHAENQIEELLSEGVEGIHLYALNRLKTVQRLGPRLKQAAEKN